MKDLIDNIGGLIDVLPIRDRAIGHEFIKTSDIESLRDLVDSALIKTLKSLRRRIPAQEYIDVDLKQLHYLKAQVDIYIILLKLPTSETKGYEYDYGWFTEDELI